MSYPRQMHHANMEEEFQVRRAVPFHLATFLYNAEKGTVMNRDSNSWGKFLISYVSRLTKGILIMLSLLRSNFTRNIAYKGVQSNDHVNVFRVNVWR